MTCRYGCRRHRPIIHRGGGVISGNMMTPVLAKKRPAHSRDDAVEQQHQKNFKLPVRLVAQ